MVLLFSLSLLSAASCAEDLGSVKEAERWARNDDPGLFSNELTRNIRNLPSQGEASPVPWAGSYWRMAQDSINYRWGGPDTLSPAEKYEVAFSSRGAAAQVSRAFGVDAQAGALPCNTDDQCSKERQEQCGKRTGMKTGRCIPFWFGVCNGWSAASILFPEPVKPVVHNGVTFEVQDIKALLSLVSTKVSTRSVALTCRANDAGGAVRYDMAGRPTQAECRDTNAGTFHILLTNYVGIQRKSLIEDRTFDDQIWNQPIRSYQIEEARIITAQDANRLVAGRGAARYLFNQDAKELAYVKTSVSYILEASSETDGNLSSEIDTFTGHDVYEYVLELDGAGSIIGGEWIGDSRRNHPDFLWIPVALGTVALAGGTIRAEWVKALADASVAP